MGLNAYAKPNEALRPVFKRFQRAKSSELDREKELLDFAKSEAGKREEETDYFDFADPHNLRAIYSKFLDQRYPEPAHTPVRYEHKQVRGK